MILILSKKDDEHVAFLAPRLERIGAEFTCLDPREFPASTSLAVERGKRRTAGRLSRPDGAVDLERVHAVWWRRPGRPEAPSWIGDTEQRENIRELAEDALGGVWESLDCLWVPCKPSARIRANHKLLQLQLAQQLGFEIPATLVTNDPAQLLDFHATHGGQIITKPLSPFVTVGGYRVSSAARRVTRRGLRRVGTLRHEAVIAQGFVPKAFELRITVVGKDVFCAAINSGSVRRAGIDWRTVHDRVSFSEHRPPPDIARRCVRLTRQMGLTFGAIDMIVTPEGRHVFLEINPAGQWGFMPKVSGDIADALALLLASGTPPNGSKSGERR